MSLLSDLELFLGVIMLDLEYSLASSLIKRADLMIDPRVISVGLTELY